MATRTPTVDMRHPLDIERVLDEMKDIRQAAGLTQEKLGDMIGVPRDYIAKYENKLGRPEFDTLVMLHRVLCGLRLEQEALAHAQA